VTGAPGRATQPLQLGGAPAVATRVLIVEDDPAMVPLLEGIAAASGLQHVATVSSGEHALGHAARADIILLDHVLAGPLTGFDVLREIRRRALAAKVVMVTAQGSEQLAAEAARAGADDYVVKDATLPHVLPGVLGRVRRLREVECALDEARGNVLRAERRAAFAELTVALSHELNNPLQALRTELELLRLRPAELPSEARGRVDAALAQVDRLADVVRRVAALDRDAATTYVGDTRMTDLSGS